MRKISAFTLILMLVTTLSVFITPTSTNACSCMEPSFQAVASRSDVIFVGKVMNINNENSLIIERRSDRGNTPVLFEVSKSYKGVNQSQIIINVDMNSSCNYSLNIGVMNI